jgi:FkbM family methyltransferase
MNKRLIRLAKPVVERFPRLAMTYRYLRDNRHANEAKATPWGFVLAGNPAMQSGQFEPDETQLAARIMSEVDVVINVGANIGYYACLALAKNKQVVAFEPMPTNLRYLLRNVKANDWRENIEIYPLALTNRTGVIEIWGSGTGASLIKGWAHAPEQSATLAACSTLDAVLGARFVGKRCLMIVDIEGAEYFMLQGALIFLNMDPKPVWMMEVSILEHQPEGVTLNPNLRATFHAFWSRGYDAWTAEARARVVRPSDIDMIVASGIDSVHTNNFVFVESGKGRQVLGD